VSVPQRCLPVGNDYRGPLVGAGGISRHYSRTLAGGQDIWHDLAVSHAANLAVSHAANLVTTDHVLAVANVILAAVALATIWSSNKVTKVATSQATATEDLAKKAGDQLEQSRQALATSVRPIIAYVLQDAVTDGEAMQEAANQGKKVTFDGRDHVIVLDEPRHIRITVPIRNIGPGPAFLKDASFNAGESEIPAVLQADVLLTGESTRFWIESAEGEPNFPTLRETIPGTFIIKIRYADAFGQQHAQAQIRVLYSDLGQTDYFSPRQVWYRRLDENYQPVDELSGP
jgi:hypothetical protein